MRRKILQVASFFLFLSLFSLLVAKNIKAESLIYIDKEGGVRSNVLSISSSADVTSDESSGKQEQEGGIVVAVKDGKTSLSFKSQLLDISSYSGNVIEDSSGEGNLVFEKSNGFIYLKKGGFSVKINSSFVYDIVKKKVSLLISNGLKKEIVTPNEINKGLGFEALKNANQISLGEDSGGTYLVAGEKKLGVISLPFEVKISAGSGKIVSIQKPSWLTFVNKFLGKG